MYLRKKKAPEMTEEKYRKKFLFPIKTFYESIGFDFSKEDFTIANDEFHLGFEQNFKKLALQPYAQDTIARFQKLGVTQSILSATVQSRLEEQVDFLALHIYLIMLLA